MDAIEFENGVKITPKLLIGCKEIGAFVGVTGATAGRFCREGRLPANRDPLGRWVMWNIDYYKAFRRPSEPFLGDRAPSVS